MWSASQTVSNRLSNVQCQSMNEALTLKISFFLKEIKNVGFTIISPGMRLILPQYVLCLLMLQCSLQLCKLVFERKEYICIRWHKTVA